NSIEDMRLTYVPRNPGWEWVVQNMPTVPVVALALAPVAGLGAARLAPRHYGGMVRGTSQVSVARPPPVERAREGGGQGGARGSPVAVLASDPHHDAGGWMAEASQKVTRFVDLADTFHLPVVHLVDQPGFVIGTQAEKASTIRHGARALAAVYQAGVPWCSVIL